MSRREIYQGKAKTVYEAEDPGCFIIEFRDSATAFDGAKRGTISGKGQCNAQVSAILFSFLESRGINTHYLSLLSPKEMLVKKLEIIPVEVVVRNVAAGSISKRLGIEEGRPLSIPVLEFYYKSDELGDPMINHYHVRALNLATDLELKFMEERALQINQLLIEFFKRCEITLVDFKLEFGRHDGKILLGDEISPDTCRLWDSRTERKLDKDRFRRDLGDVEEAYQEVLDRVRKVDL